jgi:hypothetical protein
MTTIMQHLAANPSALPSDASALEACISALKSSISALEISLKTSEGSSTPWEYLAIVSSFVVFLGIVGEIVVIVSEDRDDREDWARGIVWPPDRAPRWRFWFDIVATIVVLLGVLGEAWGSLELASINSQLRSKTSELRAKSDQLLAVVTQVAGDASASAQTAGDDAKSATADAKSATASSLEAQAHATAIGDELTKEIEKEQAAEQRLEEEKIKRIELAVSLLPRTFRDQSGAIAQLKKLPTRTALIEYLDTPECLATAEQINFVLLQAGWPTTGVPVKTVWPGEGVGVSPGNSRASTPDAPNDATGMFRVNETIGNVFVNELNKSGIEAKWLIGSRRHKLPFGVMYISVGFRPNVALEKALKELGPQEPATPLGENMTILGGNRMPFKGDNP